MAAPLFVCHSTVALCFYGSLGLLHEHSWLWSSTLLSLQAVSIQPTAVLSADLLSQPHIPALSPAPHQWTYVSGGAHRAVALTICVGLTLSCLPQTSCHALLQAPEAPLLFLMITLLVRGLPWVWEPLFSFSSPRGTGPIPLPLFFSFFLSFILLSYAGIFLVLLGVRGPLLVFSSCSVRIVPSLIRCIFDVFMGRSELHVFLLHHLD